MHVDRKLAVNQRPQRRINRGHRDACCDVGQPVLDAAQRVARTGLNVDRLRSSLARNNVDDDCRLATAINERRRACLARIILLIKRYRYRRSGSGNVTTGNVNTNPEGRWAGDFEFAFFSGDRVSITVEESGGSDEPTTDPVVNTRF